MSIEFVPYALRTLLSAHAAMYFRKIVDMHGSQIPLEFMT